MCKRQIQTSLVILALTLTCPATAAESKVTAHSLDVCATGKLTSANGIIVELIKPLSGRKVLPTSEIDRADLLDCDHTTQATPDEFEPISIVLNSQNRHFDAVTVQVSDLTGPRGRINARQVDIKLVKTWYQANGAWLSAGRPARNPDARILVPELLVNDSELVRVNHKTKENLVRFHSQRGDIYVDVNSTLRRSKLHLMIDPTRWISDANTLQPFPLRKGENQQLWLMVQVPADAMAGEYQGEVTVSQGQSVLVTRRINLEVLPFHLPEPPIEYGIYYHGCLHESGTPGISSRYKSEQQLKTELKDMFDHGFKNPIVYQRHSDSHALFQRYLAIRREVGMSNERLYLMFVNSSRLDLAAIKKDIAIVKKLAEPFGTDELYVYGRDEATGKQLTDQLPIWKALRKAGIRIYAAGYEGAFEAVGGDIDLFVFARSPMQEEADKYHKVNARIFSYLNPQTGAENPKMFRVNYGLLLWAANFDGAMVYAYQHTMGTAWNDFDHDWRDHHLTYPTTDGVVGTIAWEGLREAIDDIKYVRLLESAIATSLSDKNKRDIATSAKRWLATLRAQLNAHNRYNQPTQPVELDFTDLRRQMVGYLLALNSDGSESAAKTNHK